MTEPGFLEDLDAGASTSIRSKSSTTSTACVSQHTEESDLDGGSESMDNYLPSPYHPIPKDKPRKSLTFNDKVEILVENEDGDKELKITVENGDSDGDGNGDGDGDGNGDGDGDGGGDGNRDGKKQSIASLGWRWLTESPEEVTGELMMNKFHLSQSPYTFFYKQPHFRVEPRVAIKNPKMRLKVAMKLLSIFGIEAQGC